VPGLTLLSFAGASSGPALAQTARFAFNFSGVAAVVTLVLAYFRIQRDQAMERSERLLLNVLPPEIAERLKRQGVYKFRRLEGGASVSTHHNVSIVERPTLPGGS
jgi:hypothetical protein